MLLPYVTDQNWIVMVRNKNVAQSGMNDARQQNQAEEKMQSKTHDPQTEERETSKKGAAKTANSRNNRSLGKHGNQ